MKHHAVREGVTLGLTTATSIWIWIAVVDVLAGEPFRTFTVLGGIAGFTVLHHVLNVAYGMAIVAGVHSATREPSVMIALVFGLVFVEIGFAMATVLLSQLGLGALAWARIFGGSLIGAVIAIALLARGHPLAATLRRAEREGNG